MHYRKHVAGIGAVLVLLAVMFYFDRPSIKNTSDLRPIDDLVEQGCVIEFSSDRTRVDIPDSVACSSVRDALRKLPRLAEIRLGYGGRNEDAPIIDSYEWNQEAAEQAVNEYRTAFPGVRFRFAPGAF